MYIQYCNYIPIGRVYIYCTYVLSHLYIIILYIHIPAQANVSIYIYIPIYILPPKKPAVLTLPYSR